MSTTATFSYSQGDYTIIGEKKYDIPNVLKLTARHFRKLNNIFIGSIENVDTELHHKITCAFVNNKYTLIEDLDNNRLTIVFNLYDDTTLEIQLVAI
jgi:hypothetical protein